MREGFFFLGVLLQEFFGGEGGSGYRVFIFKAIVRGSIGDVGHGV